MIWRKLSMVGRNRKRQLILKMFLIIPTISASATCQLPPINGGSYSGDCNAGDIIDQGTVCQVTCETNFQPSSAQIECIDAGTFDNDPACIGRFTL